MKKQLYTILTAILFTVLSLVGCDTQIGPKPDPCGDGDPQGVEVTEILNIAHPDTVTEGDTVTFKVAIKDSLLPGFRYQWTTSFPTARSCDTNWPNTERTSLGRCESAGEFVQFIIPQVDSSQQLTFSLNVRHDSLQNEVKNIYSNGCLIGIYAYSIGFFDLQVLDSN